MLYRRLTPGTTLRLVIEEDTILVIDQGRGVPPEIKDEIFTPFITGRTRGLGLGAAVARRCLRRQGGDITLRHTGESGTTFALRWAEAE